MTMIPAPTARDPKPTPERILQLANRVLTGDIILPEFQRPFVWKRKQILELMDSIYKNYPIGSLLVWESKQDLASKRSIADLQVADRSEGYPVNYLLDGQQRLSAICGVIHWVPGDPRSVWNVYFDLKTNKFQHTDRVDDLPVHQIPLRRMANAPDFYRRLTPIDDEAMRARADLLFTRFLEYQVPLVTLGDMSIEDVAPVFERINSTGTRLTIYDLMRAATWSPEFDLGATVEGIKSVLQAKKYHSLDDKTFLRTLGAAAGGDFSAQSIDALRDLPLEKLTAAAEAMKAGTLRAADFLATEITAPRAEAIPYSNQFAVLSEVFRLVPTPSTSQLAEVKRWFWKTTLSSYFSGWDSGQMTQDTRTVREFAAGRSDSLGDGGIMPSNSLWKMKPFRTNSAASKMLALMLAEGMPLDLVNGQRIDVDKSLAWSNDKEYHHFFPQAFLARKGIKASQSNVVGNIVLLTSISNIKIKDKAPSEYLAEIIAASGREALVDRLQSNLVPEDALDMALRDDYEGFLTIRSEYLHAHVMNLTGSVDARSSTHELLDDSIDDSND
ncbi:DUF262 domain-containing protein [Salinibacterium sp. NSLL150]|uniref:DUF262 domain-containing protein n=1 Tax=unclassified Salinibacterium TaxID=2632331 RepID=UPI0018CF1C7D|nr:MULTISPECIES: DUF262 domain-containing protein [unclassified Salinibacterium]MBH0100224.1 DUF262 domain-containing protein [Salinibacterium sp. NSLL35]MBH0102978.1 DUF262 domain-containing protein [Salinibacterium sp. NSLL150]MBH0105738.1 DUF262 domain-containing protein [Salinibacterium sp. NSLL16]MBH0108498.1 DUF262 domain-containing protein [Salinibacterium sp. NSLL17]